MARTHGIDADRVRAIEVVTGDGEFRRVTPDSHPDLFFALRGGKGAAGIVTALEFDLVEMPTFYGGACYFAGDDMPRVIGRWRDWSADLPLAGTTSFGIFQMPDDAGGSRADRRPDDPGGAVPVDRRRPWGGGAGPGSAGRLR